MSRINMAYDGWGNQRRGFEFETSKLSSVYNKKADGTDYGDVTIKFYDDQDAELTTQGTLDTDCVKTVVDFERDGGGDRDFQILTGTCHVISVPTVDLRVWVIAAPDLSLANGGSHPLVAGINYQFMGQSQYFQASVELMTQHMQYNVTYHTSKMRYIHTHPAGHKQRILCAVNWWIPPKTE